MIDFEKLFMDSLNEKNNAIKVEKYNDLIFKLCEVISPICTTYEDIRDMVDNSTGINEESKKILAGSLLTNELNKSDFDNLLNIRDAIYAVYDKTHNKDAVSSGDTKTSQ